MVPLKVWYTINFTSLQVSGRRQPKIWRGAAPGWFSPAGTERRHRGWQVSQGLYLYCTEFFRFRFSYPLCWTFFWSSIQQDGEHSGGTLPTSPQRRCLDVLRIEGGGRHCTGVHVRGGSKEAEAICECINLISVTAGHSSTHHLFDNDTQSPCSVCQVTGEKITSKDQPPCLS